MVRLIFHIAKSLLGDPSARRIMMFYLILAALMVLFCGATFLEGWLREHLLVFVVYWGICAGITMVAVLLAVFDMLAVRSTLRRERRRIEREVLANARKDGQSHPAADND